MPCSIERVGNSLRVSYRLSVAWPIVFTVFGLAVAWMISVRSTVECVRRPDGSVHATVTSHRIGWTSAPRVVEDVRSAMVETHDERPSSSSFEPGTHGRRSRQHQPTYQVVLVDGKGGRHPVSTMRSSGRAPHAALADGVNRFVGNTGSRRAVLRQASHPVSLLILLFPVLAMLLFWTHRGECVALRDTATVHVTSWSYLFPKATAIPMADIREFAFVEATRRRGGRQRTSYQASVIRHDGSAVRFGASSDPENDDAMANALGALERFCRETPS